MLGKEAAEARRNRGREGQPRLGFLIIDALLMESDSTYIVLARGPNRQGLLGPITGTQAQ